MAYSKDIIDTVFKQFGPLTTKAAAPPECMPMTFWLPKEYKTKYEKLQKLTRGKFGKAMKEIIKASIERVSPAEKESL